VALNFSVPEAQLTERMLTRAQAEGRADDRPETIRERLRVYREKTEPLVGFYRGRDLLAEVDGVGPVPEIAQRIEEAVSAVGRPGGAA